MSKLYTNKQTTPAEILAHHYAPPGPKPKDQTPRTIGFPRRLVDEKDPNNNHMLSISFS